MRFTLYLFLFLSISVLCVREAHASCPIEGVAVSASGGGHLSSGADLLLAYPTTYTNEGAAWVPGGGTFVAPCTGLYFFTVSFTKQVSDGATSDDVRIRILQNGIYKGEAHAGQANVFRSVGTYSVSLRLNAGEVIRTYVASDKGALRYVIGYNFTGYLLKPLE